MEGGGWREGERIETTEIIEESKEIFCEADLDLPKKEEIKNSGKFSLFKDDLRLFRIIYLNFPNGDRNQFSISYLP